MIEPDMLVEADGIRGREQDEFAVGLKPALRKRDEPGPQSLMLEIPIHSEVGEIAAEVKIRNRSRDPYEALLKSAGCQDIRVREHAAQTPLILNRTPFRKGRADEHIAEFSQ